MRAARVKQFGGPEVIEVTDVPAPQVQAGDVLVRVRASALNRADLLQRRGMYAAPAGWPPDILGMEIAGEIAELGAGVHEWKKGDRVFGIVGGGGHAEFAVTRASQLARIPEKLDWTTAAAVPEAFITAHDALVTQAYIRKGDAVLVHAVGSGVGIAAAQLVSQFGGTCYGTARTADKIERAKQCGLTDGIVVDKDPAVFVDAARRWTGGKGMDVILDLVGGPYMPANVKSAALKGRVIVIGLVAGREANLDLGVILNQRLTVRGTALRSRTPEERADATAGFAQDVLPLIERGAVKPVVDTVLPLDKIADAHRLMESNGTFGKIVLVHS